MKEKEVLIKGIVNVDEPAWEYVIYEDKVGFLTGPGYESQFLLDTNREVAFQKALRNEYFEDGEAARRILTGNIIADYIYLESQTERITNE
jgi:hypothetical protein